MKRYLMAIGIAFTLLFGGAACDKLPFEVSLKKPPVVETVSVVKPHMERVIYEMNEVTYEHYADYTRAVVHIWDINSIEFSQVMLDINFRGIKDIHLDVRSPGGSVIDMLHYLDLLRQFKENGGYISSHVGGDVMSAAVPIFLMGEHRTMDRHAILMLHPHSMYGQSIKDYPPYTYLTDDDPKLLKALQSPVQKTLFEKMGHLWSVWYCEIISANTSIDQITCLDKYMEPEDWDTNTGQWYYTADEALEMGFAHRLI